MNESEISQSLMGTFEGVDVVVASGDSFFFYNPESTLPPDHRFPFVTLVTSDSNDQFSHLNRPSVFRLNIGIGKQTFHSLFGSPKLPPYGDNAVERGPPRAGSRDQLCKRGCLITLFSQFAFALSQNCSLFKDELY